MINVIVFKVFFKPVYFFDYMVIFIKIIVIVISLLTFVNIGFTRSFSVIRVVDGDTVTLEKDGTVKTIRFDGINCPEENQPYGPEAAAFTAKVIEGHLINAIEMEVGKYGRTIGVIEVGNVNLNEALISAGLTWVYNEYCQRSICKYWRRLQEEARKDRIGLWAASHPIAPWDWRHGKGREPSASGQFHGNVHSRRFHKSDCKYFNCKSCTEGFETRQQAIDAGFNP